MCEAHIIYALFVRQTRPDAQKPIAWFDADDRSCLLTERYAHSTATAPVVQHAIECRNSRLLQIREHLRAAPVFENGVVVFRSKPHGRVPADRGVVYGPHPKECSR